MEEAPERHFTPVHSTPLGIRYVLLSDIPGRLQDHCELFARSRRAVLLLPDGTTAVFYEDWLIWAESLDAGSTRLPGTSESGLRAESVKPNLAAPQFCCDCCGVAAQYGVDDGLNNLQQLSFDAGIAYALGNRKRFDLTICHACLKETFAPWLRVVSIE